MNDHNKTLTLLFCCLLYILLDAFNKRNDKSTRKKIELISFFISC